MDQCRWRSARPLPGPMSTSTFSPHIALVGAEYGEGEEPLFSEFSFAIEGLDAWLSITGIDIVPDPSRQGGLIRYCVPDDIPIHLRSGVELRFRFGLNYPKVSLLLTEAAVQQTVEAVVKLAEPRPVGYFHSIAFKLCNFLTLVLDQAVSIQSMTGYLEPVTIKATNRRKLVHIYGQYAPWPEKTANIRWIDILFRYQAVANQFESMMVNWLESHKKFEPAFNLYFAMKAQPSQFLDVKILWLCQALETLHRRSSEETEMPGQEFAALRKSLIQYCPKGRRPWLGPRLLYANQLSFRNRMRRLLEPLERWFGDEGRREAFVKTITDTRNYLTHYDEANTNNKAIGSDAMFALNQKLEALFQLYLLSLIGLDDPTVDSIIHGNRGLRRRLEV